MKKLLFLIGLAAMTMTATAQNKATFGVRAGLNVSNISVSGADESLDSKIGYQVGVAYQQPVLKKAPLYLETGLYLTTRGAKFEREGESLKFSPLYLQVPVVISWHFKVSDFSIQPYAGAYYALGIAGKIKDGDAKENIFSKIDDGDGETIRIFKRSDVGLRFGAGVTYKKHYYLGLGYDLGLTNIAHKDGIFRGDGKLKNGNFYVTVGYNF